MYTITDMLDIPKEKLTPSERAELMLATQACRHLAPREMKWVAIARHFAFPDHHPLPPGSFLEGTITYKKLAELIDRLYDTYVPQEDQ